MSTGISEKPVKFCGAFARVFDVLAKEGKSGYNKGQYLEKGERRSMLKHCLIVFLVSMVPVIELRGAIPYGVGFGLPLWLTYCVAIAGNMLPVPVIYFFARRVLVWGSGKPVIGKLFAFFLEKGERAGQKLQKKAGRGLYWALLLFVGIPLPGTGAWTGTLAASLLDMDFKKSVLACVGGVLLAGIIMGVLSQLGVEAFRAAA